MKGYDSICCFSKSNNSDKKVLWEITTCCNLSCDFCHRSKNGSYGPTLEEIKLASCILKKHKINKVIISGGEPLIRNDIFEILNYLKNESFEIDVCTNGTLVSPEIASKLSNFLEEVSISLDSFDVSKHDILRGQMGAFDDTLNGIKNLIKEGIAVHVTSLLNKDNILDIEKTVQYIRSIGVQSIAFIGEIPISKGYNFLVKNETQKYLKEVFSSLREKYKDICINTKEVFIDEGHTKCNAGSIVYGLDVDLILRPCMLLKNYEGINLRKHLYNIDTYNPKLNQKILMESNKEVTISEGVCPGAKVMTSVDYKIE